MTSRDRALRALRAWLAAHGDGAVPLAGEHGRDYEVAFDPALVAAVEAEVKLALNERDGEREAREKLEVAYRKQDAAMGVLFERATKGGLDWSDLIS